MGAESSGMFLPGGRGLSTGKPGLAGQPQGLLLGWTGDRVLGDPRASPLKKDLIGRRLDWHEQVSENSVLVLGAGLKAKALVPWVPDAQTWGPVGIPLTPEVAGDSVSHLQPLANPTGQQSSSPRVLFPVPAVVKGKAPTKDGRTGTARVGGKRHSCLTLTRVYPAIFWGFLFCFCERNWKRF